MFSAVHRTQDRVPEPGSKPLAPHVHPGGSSHRKCVAQSAGPPRAPLLLARDVSLGQPPLPEPPGPTFGLWVVPSLYAQLKVSPKPVSPSTVCSAHTDGTVSLQSTGPWGAETAQCGPRAKSSPLCQWKRAHRHERGRHTHCLSEISILGKEMGSSSVSEKHRSWWVHQTSHCQQGQGLGTVRRDGSHELRALRMGPWS